MHLLPLAVAPFSPLLSFSKHPPPPPPSPAAAAAVARPSGGLHPGARPSLGWRRDLMHSGINSIIWWCILNDRWDLGGLLFRRRGATAIADAAGGGGFGEANGAEGAAAVAGLGGAGLGGCGGGGVAVAGAAGGAGAALAADFGGAGAGGAAVARWFGLLEEYYYLCYACSY